MVEQLPSMRHDETDEALSEQLRLSRCGLSVERSFFAIASECLLAANRTLFRIAARDMVLAPEHTAIATFGLSPSPCLIAEPYTVMGNPADEDLGLFLCRFNHFRPALNHAAASVRHELLFQHHVPGFNGYVLLYNFGDQYHLTLH